MTETILGVPGAIFWLWFSAFFYSIAVLFFWNPLKKEKTELMYAFFAFLFGMAVFHILLGFGFLWNSHFLIILGAFAALTGTAYTLKFPLTALRNHLARKILFYIALTIAWLIVAWLIIFPHMMETMFWLVFGYMILVSGGISGFYIVWTGFKLKERWLKIKCIGGGSAIITCCFVADLMFLLMGMSVLGEIFMALAPMILISSIYLGRYLQRRSENREILSF